MLGTQQNPQPSGWGVVWSLLGAVYAIPDDGTSRMAASSKQLVKPSDREPALKANPPAGCPIRLGDHLHTRYDEQDAIEPDLLRVNDPLTERPPFLNHSRSGFAARVAASMDETARPKSRSKLSMADVPESRVVRCSHRGRLQATLAFYRVGNDFLSKSLQCCFALSL
jgi:hypothetical protein